VIHAARVNASFAQDGGNARGMITLFMEELKSGLEQALAGVRTVDRLILSSHSIKLSDHSSSVKMFVGEGPLLGFVVISALFIGGIVHFAPDQNPD
jgi:hypothetical protein